MRRSAKDKRVGLRDVAEAAGVSVATASRVLSKPEMVTPESRERVEEAMRALNYTPDRVAQALSLGRSTTIGAIVPTLGIAAFADGVECLQNRLDDLGYTLLLGNSQYDPRKELKHIRAFAENNVAGLILVAGELGEEAQQVIRGMKAPVVCTYMHESPYGFPSVGIDNRKATSRLVRHLVELGHRKFAVISNTVMPNARSAARRDGALEALAEAGLSLMPGALVEVDAPTVGLGRSALARILDAAPDVTAVICTTDSLAVGVLAECRARSIRVPEDMSVTGYDDMDLAAHISPALTTVGVRAIEVSNHAIEMLMALIARKRKVKSIELDADLALRASVGPPPV